MTMYIAVGLGVVGLLVVVGIMIMRKKPPGDALG